MKYEYRVWVRLAGELRYHLCTIVRPEMVGELVASLCRPERPEYATIEVEIVPTHLTG